MRCMRWARSSVKSTFSFDFRLMSLLILLDFRVPKHQNLSARHTPALAGCWSFLCLRLACTAAHAFQTALGLSSCPLCASRAPACQPVPRPRRCSPAAPHASDSSLRAGPRCAGYFGTVSNKLFALSNLNVSIIASESTANSLRLSDARILVLVFSS